MRKSRLSTKLTLSFVSIIFFLGGSEIVLRLAGYGPRADRLQWLSHEDLQYIPAPNQNTFFGNDNPETGEKRLPIRINKYSQRGSDYPLEKDKNEYRIIGLGDSLTFGPGVLDGETYLAVLQEIYKETTPLFKHIRVINAAVNGYATIHYLRWMETQVDKYNPDHILVGCYVGNDMVVPIKGRIAHVPMNNIMRKFAICHFIHRVYYDFLWKHLTATTEGQPVEEIEKRLARYAGVIEDSLSRSEKVRLWEHSLGHIKRMAEIARIRRIAFTVLLIPTPFMVLKQREFPLYNWLQKQLEAMGISVITLLHALRPLGRDGWLSYDLGHMSPAGHRTVARRVYEELKLEQSE